LEYWGTVQPQEAMAWWITRRLSPVFVNLNVQVTFSDSGNVPKSWLVFSNLIPASPAAKAISANTDKMVVNINFFIFFRF
jgi:hypothetical protein